MSKSSLLAPSLVFLCLGACYWWTTASSRSLHISKRASFYIANETVCVVDGVLFRDGESIPSDDPCESCKCRPPGFACVLRNCEVKPGCKAVRKEGECCPEYICGCEHNGIVYKDGDEIRNTESPCYTCFCRGSSIACALVDCYFRHDCEPTYVPGECCPRYDKCPPEQTNRPISVTSTTTDYYKQNEVQYANRVQTPVVYSEPEISLVGFHVESDLGEGNVGIEPARKPDIPQVTEHEVDEPEQSQDPSHPTVTSSTDAPITSPEKSEENTHQNTDVPETTAGENQDGLFSITRTSNYTTTTEDHTPTALPESLETTAGAQETISKVDLQENDGVDDIIPESISETNEFAGTDSSTQNEKNNTLTSLIDKEVTKHGNLVTVNVNPSSTQKPVVLITKGDTLSVTPQSIPVEDQIIVKTNPKDETQTSKLQTEVTTLPNNRRQQEENLAGEFTAENDEMVTTTSIYSTTVTAESNGAEGMIDGVRGHLTVIKNVTVVERESPSNKTKNQMETEESVTQTQQVTNSHSSTESNDDINSPNLSNEDKELTSKNENIDKADVTYPTTLSKDIQPINVESKEQTTSTPYSVDSKLTNTDSHNEEASIAQSTSNISTVESSAETASEQISTVENNNENNQEEPVQDIGITMASTTQIPDRNLVMTTTELQDKTDIPKLISSDFKNDQDGASKTTALSGESGTEQPIISETTQQSGTSELTTIHKNEDKTLEVETQGSLAKDQDKIADDSKVHVASNSSDSLPEDKNHVEKEETSNVPLTKDINITSATSESKLQQPNGDTLSAESLGTLPSGGSATTNAIKQPFAKSADDQLIIIKEIKELVVPVVDQPQEDAVEDINKVKQTEEKVVEQSMPLDEGIFQPSIKDEIKVAHGVPNNTISSVSQPKEEKTKQNVDKNNNDTVIFYIDTNKDELADIIGVEEKSNSTKHSEHNNNVETPEATENVHNISNQTDELTNLNKTVVPVVTNEETISTTCKVPSVMLDVSTAQPESGNHTEQSESNPNKSILPANIEPKSEDPQKVTESQNASGNVSIIYYSSAEILNSTTENGSAMDLQVNNEKSTKNDKYDDGSQNVTFIETLPLQQNISDKLNTVADQDNALLETQFFAAEQSIVSILGNETFYSSTANISDSSHNKTTSLTGENCTSTADPATQTEDVTKLETSSNNVTFYSLNSSVENKMNANETNETSTIFSPSNESEEITDLPETTRSYLSPIPILYSAIKDFKTQNGNLENSSQPQTENDSPESLISSSIAEETSQTTVFPTQSPQSKTTTLQPKSIIPHDFLSKTVMSHFFHDISHHESPNFYSAYLGSNLPYKNEHQGVTRDLQRDQNGQLQDKHLSVSNMLINKGANASQGNSSHSDVNLEVKVLQKESELPQPTFNITESGHDASTVADKLKDSQSTETSNNSKAEEPDKSIQNQKDISVTKSNIPKDNETTIKTQQDSTVNKQDEGTGTMKEQDSVSLWEEGTTTKDLVTSSSS